MQALSFKELELIEIDDFEEDLSSSQKVQTLSLSLRQISHYPFGWWLFA
jgi:hypothetical protein